MKRNLFIPPIRLALFLALVATNGELSSAAKRDICRTSIPLYQQHDNKLFFKVQENAPNGTCVGHLRSADDQRPEMLIIPKKNSSDSSIDRLDSITDAELLNAFRLTKDGDLLTNSPLDRERREYYKFTALCMEQFCEISITVQIEDVNDNAPKFYLPPDLHQLPSVIPEDYTKENISSIVVKWPEGQSRISYELPVAIDLDIGTNGIQEFVLRDPNSTISIGNRIQNIFCLVEHGAPSTTHCNQEALDQENSNQNLAANSGSGSGSSSSNAVDDIRQPFIQQAPVLVTSKQAQSYMIKGSTMGGLVVQAAATPVFSHTRSSISLVNLKPLDREQQPRYQFIVQVVDGGQPPLIGRLLVTVEVTDINDNDPIFEKNYYEIRVKENATIGSSLLIVSAHDADLDANAQISYHISSSSSSSSLSNNQATVTTGSSSSSGAPSSSSSSQQQQQQGFFKIDPTRGEIILSRPLDYELDSWHELKVEARDHGSPARSSVTKVKIIVDDVDEIDLSPPILRSPSPQQQQQQQQQQLYNQDLSSSLENRNKPSPLIGQAEKFLPSSENTGFISANWAVLTTRFDQIISQPSYLYTFILITICAISLIFCLVKIKSSLPESDDYANTALTPNNGQTKQSPNHSLSNGHDHQHNHHNHHSHHSHHNQRHEPSIHHRHSPSHNQYQVASLPLHSSSSNRHNHHNHNHNHHQSATIQQQLPHTPCDLLGSGLMSGAGGGGGGGGSFSQWHRTPGSTMEYFMSGNGHALHAHGAATIGGSGLIGGGGGGGGIGSGTGGIHVGGGGGHGGTLNSTLDCIVPPPGDTSSLASQQQQPLDRWFDLGVSSQLVMANDLYGSYNWDYLADWMPEYQPLMPIVQNIRQPKQQQQQHSPPWTPQWTTHTTSATCQPSTPTSQHQ